MRPRGATLIFAKCEACDRHGLGAKAGSYFGKTYMIGGQSRVLPRFKKNIKCENCKGPMTILRESKLEERP